MKYQKPPLSYDEQLDLLISRGLSIKNRNKAVAYLKNISYYRLSAYFIPFKQSDTFTRGVSFENIINLYTFDRKLRLLVLDAIEPIEVALRTQIIYHLSHKYGAFGYLDSQNFSHRFDHRKWLLSLNQVVDESTETFISHYHSKYSQEEGLPIWMAIEVISFGGLSRLLSGMKGEDQREIARRYHLQDVVLSSWLRALVYLRNLCAHHSRLWNRTLTVTPKLPMKSSAWMGVKSNRVYGALMILQYLLGFINPASKWKNRLLVLLEAHPEVFLPMMGFQHNWLERPIWSES